MRVTVVAVGVGVVVALAATTEAQPGEPSPVVMSSAGGISKGSYQAGVDWTISEYLRRQRAGEFRARLAETLVDLGARAGLRELLEDLLVPAGPRELALQSATGASAGNINVFAALGWCTETLETPNGRVSRIALEDSLFWRTWVNTGIAQLLPAAPPAEPAALSREFFERQHKQTILDYLRAATATSAECTVPVGLTLTKVVPATVAVAGNAGEIGVQRFASVLSVTAAGAGAERYLDFTLPPTEASYGALAVLPNLRNSSSEKRRERLDDVFAVMLASSAFPVAFAPKTICYEPGGLLQPRQEAPVVCSQFSDGGLFDNNPIGLAVGLVETPKAAGGRAAIRVAYSSPGNYRGPLALHRRTPNGAVERSGLGAAAQLLLNAFESARDYELQSLSRQIERDSELFDVPRPQLMLSSRRTPIVGETLNSFGGFLGRPFREYDFLTGVYDGLEFVARHFVCGGHGSPAAKDSCTADVHARLVTSNVMELGHVPQTVATWHLRAEYPVVGPVLPAPVFATVPAPALGPLDADRLVLLERVHRSLSAAAVPQRCGQGADIIASMLCPGGLGALLSDLSADATVRAAVDRLAGACDTAAGGANDRGECSVDPAFASLLRRPQREVYAMLRRGIRNVERGERAVSRSGSAALSWPAKAAYSLFRSATMRYRDGVVGPFEFNRSSSALGGDNLLATAAGVLVPNYVHNIVVNDRPDQSAVGWQPVSAVVNDRIYLNTQFELFLRDVDWDTLKSRRVWDHTAVGASVGTFALPRVPVLGKLTSLDVGVLRMPAAFPGDLSTPSRRSLRLSTRFAADKLMLTVLHSAASTSVTFGLSDLNGLAYWLLR